MRNYTFLDIETTGLDPEAHEIIEIGFIVVDSRNMQLIESRSIKVRPRKIETASPEAIAVNGYSKEKWKAGYAMDLRDALWIVSESCTDTTLVCKNVSFDWSFLKRSFSRKDIPDPFHYQRLDIQSMEFGRSGKILRLSEMCDKYGIVNRDEHMAIADAVATWKIFEKMVGRQD